MDLHHLRNCSLPLWRTLWTVGLGLWIRTRCCLCPSMSSRPRVHILRRSILRSVLLRLHPAEHSSPAEDRHIRKRAGRVVPIHGTAVGLGKIWVAFVRATEQNRSGHP